MLAAPAASHAVKKARELVTTGTPKQSGIPRAIGFNGFLRTLPGDRAFLPPSPRNAKALSRVDVSVETSGPHDFAVRRNVVRLSTLRASIASRANKS
jgi:hypothetical protein